VEIDAARLALAKHNAGVYGVAERIEWVCGDFLRLSHRLVADAVFIAPPWGGPSYLSSGRRATGGFDLESGIPIEGGAHGVMRAARRVSPNIAFVLPRHASAETAGALGDAHCGEGSARELERNFINGKLKMTTAFFGALAVAPRRSESRRGVGEKKEEEAEAAEAALAEEVRVAAEAAMRAGASPPLDAAERSQSPSGLSRGLSRVARLLR
jgi:hypothetical protein